jgi:hypothetical protein
MLLNCLARLYLSHISLRVSVLFISVFLELFTDQLSVQIGSSRFILSLCLVVAHHLCNSMFCFRVILRQFWEDSGCALTCLSSILHLLPPNQHLE